MSAFLAAAAAIAVLVCAAGAQTQPPVPSRFSHVVVIVFENKEAGQIAGNPDAPTFNSLATRGASLSDYTGVAHPSLPNYLALVSGSTHGITSDCTDCLVDGRSLADTLASAHRTWKTYAERLPRPGFTGAEAGSYVKKHVPFLYFRRVLSRPAWRRRVVPLKQLRPDLARRLPDFSLVIPDVCHDMHDCSIATGDNWLAHWLEPLLASRQLKGGVVFVIFDEGRTDIGGGGRTDAYAVGPAVQPGAENSQALSHYDLLATIEAAWHLPRLGKSATATPILGIWRGGN